MREIQGRKAPSSLLFISPLLLLSAPPFSTEAPLCVLGLPLSLDLKQSLFLGRGSHVDIEIGCVKTVVLSVSLCVERLEYAAGTGLGS